MKKIIFVTSNKGKLTSAKSFLKKYGICVVQKSLEIPEPRGSFEEIAIQKARYAHRKLKEPLIVMDAGFFVHSLNGFPMMFTNFVLETIGVEGILKLAEDKGKTCEFKEVLCYLGGPRKKPKLFKRVVKGELSGKPKGVVKPYHWSELALVFIPEGERKTMAEMAEREFMNFCRRVDNRSHWEQFGEFYSRPR